MTSINGASSLSFNPHHVVCSRYGSYLSVTLRNERLYLQSMYAGLGTHETELFELHVIDAEGNLLSFDTQMRSDGLYLECETGIVQMGFAGKSDAYIRGEGVGLRLIRSTEGRQFDNAYSPDGHRWEVNAYDAKIKAGLRALHGKLDVQAPWNRSRSDNVRADFLPGDDGKWTAQIHLYESIWQPDDVPEGSINAHIATAEHEFAAWLNTTLPVPDRWHNGWITAAYINWSTVVAPHGFHKRPTMLMSKNFMNKVWSWDNCFNALALAEQDAALAWDQLMLFFDHQDEQGAIPDHLTDSSMSYRFYKPPVHGWTLRKLMRTPGVVDGARLHSIYEPLARWTKWWFAYRDDDRDGLPQYNHGNESGWDNGTVFAEGVPVESPDLAAYLIIQMDVLSDAATRLGLSDEAAAWSQQAEALYGRMMAHFWDGERWVAKHANTHEVIGGDSSLVLMPLLLGDRLPQDVRDHTVAEVKRLMTAHGIASEHPESDYYESDGYWRGPIWAPSTYLIVDGLLACGETELALEISRRFCAMADQNGMAENYDALTGAHLRDRAYTWTSSVFLLLGNLVLKAENGIS